MKIFRPHLVFPFVLAALLLGLAGGAVRLGAPYGHIPGAAAGHGLLMVGGFLGTLIVLERAMVMKSKGWLVIPFLSSASIPATLWSGWSAFGPYLLLLASAGLIVIMYLQSVKHPVTYQFVLLIGAVSWFIGNFMLIQSGFIPSAVHWWMGFVLFTIVGERLELSKFLPTPACAKFLLNIALAIFFVGMWLPFHGPGNWLRGGSILFIAAWLLWFDMAKVAARKEGQFRYIGIGLIVGYGWLLLHGVILVSFELHPLYYDLFIHSFFLGFAFSMIWGHAPIILPVVLGIAQKPYHPILWVGWLAFQVSLMGRMVSAWQMNLGCRTWFGIANGWTILAMFGLLAVIILLKRLASDRTGEQAIVSHKENTKAFKNAGYYSQ